MLNFRRIEDKNKKKLGEQARKKKALGDYQFWVNKNRKQRILIELKNKKKGFCMTRINIIEGKC